MEAGTVPDAPEVPDAPPENAEVVVEVGGQLTLGMGGDKFPTRSMLTITGGKFAVNGEFRLGQRLSLVLQDADGEQLAKAPLVVDRVAGKQFIDNKTGDVTDVERQHTARVQK